MFQSAVLKLSLSYLAMIMVVSIGFSIALYHVSSNELDNVYQRERSFVRPLFEGGQGFDRMQRLQGEESRNHLRANLYFFNLLTFVVGGAASYYLARRTLRPIQDAMEAQSRFTADASHELRTPLAAMQAENEVALRDPKLTREEARELLQSNLEEVAKLKRLSDGLLRLARQDSSGLPKESVPVNTLVATASERVARGLEGAKITLQDDTTDLSVVGDKETLAELFVILIDNAIKYSPPETTIEISSQRIGKAIHIVIADQGYGIKAADAPYIFQRFYRADSSRTKNQTEGYGLGLSIAEQIVKIHGGRIDMQSIVGKGSTFTIVLPAAAIS